MAKRAKSRPAAKARKRGMAGRKKAAARNSAKRQKRPAPARRTAPKKRAKAKVKPIRKVRSAKKKARSARKVERVAAPLGKAARLDRERRTLDDPNIPTPPSSLDMDRRGTAARTGRAEMFDARQKHGGMNAVTAGDVDVNAEDAYFTGEEAPGGDNPTPDQDVVDDIGKALGVQYQDDEELQGADKVAGRDKHRWELDPASSEDYKGRK
jgi:Family of unknown function (DUF6335)